MDSIETREASGNGLLSGYVPEDEMARERGCTERALRAERQRGDGPPWVKINRQIFYPVEGFRDWLKRIEQRPVRARKAS